MGVARSTEKTTVVLSMPAKTSPLFEHGKFIEGLLNKTAEFTCVLLDQANENDLKASPISFWGVPEDHPPVQK